jgi:hypothetical protein
MAAAATIADKKDWAPDLFAYLWSLLAPLAGRIATEGWDATRTREFSPIRELLENAGAGAVPTDVINYLTGTVDPFSVIPTIPSANLPYRWFVVAQSIDLLFERIHPRSRDLAVPASSSLATFRCHRAEFGHYSQKTDHGIVVPKSPLAQGAMAHRNSSGGDAIEGFFEFLVRMPPEKIGGRYAVEFVLPPFHRFAPTSNFRVGFVPLVQRLDELVATATTRGARQYLDIRPSNLAKAILISRAQEATAHLCKLEVDIAIFPELCVDEEIRRAIADVLRAASAAKPSVVIAGSGLVSSGGAHAFNQAIVFDASGSEVWHQEKLNHYDMAADNRKKYGLPSVKGHEGSTHREDCETGNVLRFCEHPFWGRLVSLICEDLQQTAPGGMACEILRPDWIFAPIFDGPITIGRWSHRRGWDLAERAGAKVVVANSMALVDLAADPMAPRGVGLCIDGYEARRAKVVHAQLDSKGGTLVEVVAWDPNTWAPVTIA